jgi:DNA-directed RNA polymerase I subunit RPA1
MKEIVILQLRLVDAGFVSEAQNLEDMKLTFCKASKNSSSRRSALDADEVPSDEKVEKAYNKLIKKFEKLLSKEDEAIPVSTKTSAALRLAIIHSLVVEASSSTGSRTKCIHCQLPLKRVRYANKKIIISVGRNEMLEASRFTNADQDEDDPGQKSSMKTIVANECREILREIFENDGEILLQMYPVLQRKNNPFNTFFLDVVPVIPPNFRPANHVRDVLVEHPQTKAYHNIVLFNNQLRYILIVKKSEDGEENLLNRTMQEEADNIFKLSRGESGNEKIFYKWEELQNLLSEKAIGIKQIIEKKEHLVRMHMMGKRVNYACRTVITPDPNIEVDSLGIPEAFAMKLTYPVPVTPWNVSMLRKMVLNGPDIHPGACFIESSSTGSKRAIPREASKRELMANTLLKPDYNDGVKIVHRHLLNGDVMLLNRQPTLHRPSIMAHKARILKGEKTFKLHYSNCKSYNADFDGDEMNAHLPQNEVGRSEAYNLVNVASHYLVPKDGTPLGGLIQDHMISGVKISMRGRFFSKDDYQQLVYQALSNKLGNIKLLPPTIIKPFQLWSGKQIFSTIIINIIPEGCSPINLQSTAKIGTKSWERAKVREWISGGSPLKGNEMSEAEVIFRHGELLVGVLDKNHYGSTPYGLIHCIYELYGGEISTKLLSSLTRLFTAFLQWEGFTLGVNDILVVEKADKERKEIIKESRTIGRRITCQALDVPESVSDEELIEKLEEAYATDPKFRAVLDRKYKTAMDTYTNSINKVCLPAGLICKFPDNNLQLMVTSGAKGSTVNTMQISCLLGQIELEGKRPPIMINGKSLPSFPLFECSPKSGGFIDGRFMTGIEAQGFLFHCMAGREG